MMDFASINTETLARDTRDQASRVWEVTDAVWMAALAAFVSMAGASVAALTILWFVVVIHPVMLVLFVAIWPLFENAWSAHSDWRKSLKACAAFTAEMEARNTELRKRAA